MTAFGKFCAFAVGSLLASALLAAPVPGDAQEIEVGDLMARMETAYTDIVNFLLLVPVKESADESPFGEVEKRLAGIAEVARLLPRLEDYKTDNAFLAFAKKMEKQAGEIASLAKKKDQAASVAALSRLQAACLDCHKSFRF